MFLVGVLAVGVPAALVALSRSLLGHTNPLAGMHAPWTWQLRQVKDALTHSVDQDSIVATLGRVGLCVAWLALAVLLTNVGVEWRAQRTRGESARAIRGFSWSQAIAGHVVAGLMALSTVVPGHLASAAELPTRTPVATLVLPAHAQPLPIRSGPATTTRSLETSWRPYQVRKGDSVYGIAARLAGGDRSRTRDVAQQILDRNLGHVMADGQRFTTPGYIQVGWTLEIPTTPARIEQPTDGASDRTWTVKPGESYWAIAGHHLEQILSREPTNAEILAHTRELIAVNAARLGNRTPVQLLYPNDVVLLPSLNGHPPALTVPPKVAPGPPPQHPSPPTATTTTTTPAPPPLTPGPTASTSNATRTPTTLAATTEADAASGQAEPQPEPTPWRALTISSLFATAAVASLVRLRRRRLARRRPGHRLAPASLPTRTTETILRAEAKPNRIDGLRLVLAGLAGRVRLTGGGAPLIRAVQLAQDHVELLWSIAQPSPPTGWTSTDGGWSWRHPYPDVGAGIADTTPLLPTLVPLGLRGGGDELLLDLEAAGSLSITGDPVVAKGILDQIVLTMGGSTLVDIVDVICVGYRLPVAEHLDRVRRTTAQDAARWVAARVDEHLDILRSVNASSTLAARLAARKHDHWEAVIVVVDMSTIADEDRANIERAVERCTPGSGAIVVAVGDIDTNLRITCQDASKATWTDTDITFAPAWLSDAAADQLADLLDHTATAGEEPLDGLLNDHPFAGGAVDGASTEPVEAEMRPTARDYDVLVRVLGEVTVEGCHAHLSEAEIELLAVLTVLRPDGLVNIDRLATMLSHDEWRTPRLRSVQARISSLRHKLGLGTDGKPLLPDARTGNNSPGRYTVSDRVITDVELLDARYQQSFGLATSEAVDMLRSALELVRGRPFSARVGYTWAHDECASLRAKQVVADAAGRLIELASDTGVASLAAWAVGQANRCIDDPIEQLPFRRVESELARRTGDPSLLESQKQFRRRLEDLDDPMLDVDTS